MWEDVTEGLGREVDGCTGTDITEVGGDEFEAHSLAAISIVRVHSPVVAS